MHFLNSVFQGFDDFSHFPHFFNFIIYIFIDPERGYHC